MSVLSPTNFETVDYNMPNWSAIINTNWQTLNSYMAKYGIIWNGGTDDTGIKWDSASSTWIVCTITDTDIANHVASITNPHITKMANLSDAVLTTPAANQFLQFNGTDWVNVDNTTTTTLAALTDTVITTPANGQGLFFNGTDWINTSNISGTIVTAAQPNITYLGTLTSLTLSGNIVTSGQLYADGGIHGTTPVASSHGHRFTASNTWVVPANITSVIISGVGAGGGGGAGVAGDSGGGGGGSGQHVETSGFSVVAGDTLTITIGAGGAGGVGAAGTAGTDTTIVDSTSSTTIMTLKGGLPGGYGDVTTPVSGGGGRTNSAGGGSGYLIATATSVSVGGAGGASSLGGGGQGGIGTQAGSNAGTFGAGGGGGAGGDGGNGSGGLLFFYW